MGPRSAIAGEEAERSGDTLVYEGDLDLAKVGYGRAIDAYLDARLYDAAIRTCRKLIRLAPDVVRTHYTLLYLLAGDGRGEESVAVLAEYVRAVRQAGRHEQAVPRLVLLLHVTDDAALRAATARALAELGAEEVGKRALESVGALDRAGILASRERWARLLDAAIR